MSIISKIIKKSELDDWIIPKIENSESFVVYGRIDNGGSVKAFLGEDSSVSYRKIDNENLYIKIEKFNRYRFSYLVLFDKTPHYIFLRGKEFGHSEYIKNSLENKFSYYILKVNIKDVKDYVYSLGGFCGEYNK